MPILARFRAFPMTMAVHCFRSVSCHSPLHLTTVGPLSYHVKLTDAMAAPLGWVTGSPCPHLVAVAIDQHGAPRLAPDGPTFTRVKVHCRLLCPDVDATSMVHGD